MSAFYLLGVLTLWGWLTWLLWQTGRRFLRFGFAHSSLRLVLLAVAALAWFGGSFWEAGGKKLYWDAKVREMCEQDGGIRVYETVKLSADKFNEWGQPNFYRPDQGEDALGSEYVFITKIETYRSNNPSISKRFYRIIRRKGNVLLGESITYVRSDGDFPGPWFGSRFRCPEQGGIIPLLVAVFQQSTGDGVEK